MWIILCNPNRKPTRMFLLLSLCYERRNWVFKKLNNLFKVKQGRSHKAAFEPTQPGQHSFTTVHPSKYSHNRGVGACKFFWGSESGWKLKHVLNREGGEGAEQEGLFWQKAEQVQRPSRWRNKACWRNWQARLPEAQRPRGRAVQEEGGREAYTTALWMTLIFLPRASGSSCIVVSWLVTPSHAGFQKVTLPARRKVFSQG